MYTKTFWKFWNLTSHGSLWGGQNWKITVSKMLPTPFFFLKVLFEYSSKVKILLKEARGEIHICSEMAAAIKLAFLYFYM